MTVTMDAIDVLVEICIRLIPELIHDLEVNYGIKTVRRMSEVIRRTIQHYAPKDQADLDPSRKETSRTLCDTLFSESRQDGNRHMKLFVYRLLWYELEQKL